MMIRQELARIAREVLFDPIPGVPEADFHVAPASGEEAAALLEFASNHALKVLFWGSGSHQEMGHPVEPEIVMSTSRLNAVVDWQVDDLTVVVQPGVLISDLEAEMQQHGQTAMLPEHSGEGTVGGTVAAGLSGWRRLRYGPTRDRMLEVRIATGDGRLIRGGGRLVKNVTGYDLPRLAAGSFGSLGLITEMCLKLWPMPPARAMVRVADPVEAMKRAFRPLAVVVTPAGATLYLGGTEQEVAAQAKRLGGDAIEGHRWPEPLVGSHEMSMRVAPSDMIEFVGLIDGLGLDYQAAIGVGEVRFIADKAIDELGALREKAEASGGSLVQLSGEQLESFDPWGTPPPSLDLQRRVKAAFDPRGVANPGRLPGGI